MTELVEKDKSSEVDITQPGVHGEVKSWDLPVCIRWSFYSGVKEVAEEIDRHSCVSGLVFAKTLLSGSALSGTKNRSLLVSGASQSRGSAGSIAPIEASAVFLAH